MGGFEDLQGMCQRAGLKATHQRLEILREMSVADDHPAVEEIHRRVRERIPTISLDTVYRTLATFEQRGVIARLHVLDGRVRYDPIRDRHDHFVCSECKTVIDCQAPGADLVKIPKELKSQGAVASIHIEFRGLCKTCLEARDKRKK